MAEPVDELEKLTQVEPAQRGRAFQQALAAAAHPDIATRVQAAQVLAVTGTPAEALGALAKLLGDSVFAVRVAAAAAIAGTPWRDRLDLLASVLGDKESSLAFVAADGLAHAGDRRCVDVLLRFAAVRAHRFGALDSLLALNDPAMIPLAKRLSTAFFTNPFERALAAIVLSAEGDDSARKRLREKLAKPRAEERPFIVVHLASVDPVEGRRAIEQIARRESDDMRESALLALAKIDNAWWTPAIDVVRAKAASDPATAAELLLGLFDIDAEKASIAADSYVGRDDALGAEARTMRLKAALRREFPHEVLLRCD